HTTLFRSGTVSNEHRHLDGLQVLAEIGLGECFNAFVVGAGRAHHSLAPPVVDQALDWLRACSIEAVERTCGEVDVKLGSLGSKSRAQAIKHLDGNAVRIPVRFDHTRWNRADEHRLRNAAGFGPRDIPGNLSAARRMTYVVRSSQFKRIRQRRHVSGIGIHVVARRTLSRTTMTTAVMCDNPVPLREEVEHLVVPVISTQRPSMMEDNCLSVARTPVLVEDAGTIPRGHSTQSRRSWTFRSS